VCGVRDERGVKSNRPRCDSIDAFSVDSVATLLGKYLLLEKNFSLEKDVLVLLNPEAKSFSTLPSALIRDEEDSLSASSLSAS
jgi:hypothetical protein